MRTSKESVGLLTGSIRGLSAAMRNMGIAVTAASAVSGAAMLSLSRRAERVNAAFREVNSITSEVEDSQETYGDLVSELNTEFGLQANRLQVIDALYQSVSAGVDEAEESQREFLTTAADLAVVGLVDLETSVDVLSTAINAYGEETEFAEEAASALFQTVQFGKVTLDELAPVMGRITALGAEMDVSIQELGASMAVLTRTGFEARIAATGLRAILRSMMRPSEEMQELLRDIALDQDLFAESMDEGAESVRSLAQDYRNASERLRELEQAQKDVRREIRESSLVVQEARLLQTAIERDARSEAEELIQTEKLKGSTYEELEEIIDEYAFQVEKARVEEEQLNLESEKLEETVEDLEDEFSEAVGSSGDLQGGLGQLVLENEGLVNTLVELRKRADEQGVAFDELFPRTRALQGALALVGEDGSLLLDIFEDMRNGTIDVEEAWDDMDESVRENFDSIEEFKDVSEDMETFDLEEAAEDMFGPLENSRNATSRLGEAFEDLGQIVNEEVFEAISAFSRSVSRFVDRFEEMDDSARQGIARFAVLATSIGLVIGPMLLLGGQLALIASAMGVGLAPVLVIVAGLFGLFAASLSTAVSGGEQAEELFSNMQNIFDSLIAFVRQAIDSFNEFIVPELVNLGQAFYDLLVAITGGFGDVGEEGRVAGEQLDSLAQFIAGGIAALTSFIEENEELIASLVKLALDVIINDVIPAIAALARGIGAVLADIDWSMFIWIGIIVLGLVSAIVPVVQWIGEWMQRNSDLIATVISLVAVVGLIVAGVAKFVALVGTASVAISSAIATVQTFVMVLSMVLRLMGPLALIKSTIISLFPKFAAGVSAISFVFGKLVKVIGVVIGALSAKVIAIGIVIAAVGFLIASIWIARDEILEAVNSIVDAWKEVFDDLYAFITGELSWREAGASIVQSLADGMTGALGALRDGASKVASVIGGYLPTSPAEKGYFSDNPPTEIGEGISKNVASGLNLESDIGSEFDDLESAEFDVESDMETVSEVESESSSIEDRTAGREQKTEITIENGAIEVGPFEGIADEELPRKVGEEVDESLNEIVQRLEAKGVEIT